ncbi:MAG TPA: hypothetical protein VIP70_09735 [Nitrososphaeraceae archaeon]|jgi:hypothetical protein
MNRKGTTSILQVSIAISGILVWIFTLANFMPSALAQVSNMTGSGGAMLSNNTGTAGLDVQSPEAAMRSVIEEARNTNATGFAIGNIINQTGLNGSSSGAVAPSDNTTMKSVIEEARNTNATSFATQNIINQTGISNNTNSSP